MFPELFLATLLLRNLILAHLVIGLELVHLLGVGVRVRVRIRVRV